MNIAYLRALLQLPLESVQLISSFLPMRCVICGEIDRPVLIKDGFNTYQFCCISCFVSCLDDDSSPHKSIDTSESSVNDTSGVKDPEDLGSVTDYPSWWEPATVEQMLNAFVRLVCDEACISSGSDECDYGDSDQDIWIWLAVAFL